VKFHCCRVSDGSHIAVCAGTSTTVGRHTGLIVNLIGKCIRILNTSQCLPLIVAAKQLS